MSEPSRALEHYVVTLFTEEGNPAHAIAVGEVFATDVDDAITQSLAQVGMQYPDFLEWCERAHVVADDTSTVVREIPYARRLAFMPDGA